MALVLDATVGGASANSYATAAEGTTYHESHLYPTDWTGASTATKEAALVMATRLLDQLVEWSGFVVNSTQALLWPRVGMYYRSGYVVPPTVIPAELKNATAEFARLLIASDLTAASDVEDQKILGIVAGPVELTFGSGVTAKRVPDSVVYLLPPDWGVVRSRNSGVRELVRC